MQQASDYGAGPKQRRCDGGADERFQENCEG